MKKTELTVRSMTAMQIVLAVRKIFKNNPDLDVVTISMQNCAESFKEGQYDYTKEEPKSIVVTLTREMNAQEMYDAIVKALHEKSTSLEKEEALDVEN